VKNYSAAEVDSLLQTIKAVCPIGNEHWEVVAELHSNRYAVCGRTAESIKRKFSSLASTQPSSGNPTMPPAVALAKEIREAISHRAGITDADLSDFFEEEEEEEEEYILGTVMPNKITVSTNQEAAVITQPEQPETHNNQQQLVTTATQRDRRASGGSSGHLSTLASVSVAQSKARTRQNVISSAIETATTANNAAFASLLQQKQMSEEFEARQRRIEREEARARREEELFELRQKELKMEEQRYRQEEQRNMMFQLALTGIMAYFGAKAKEDNDNKKPPEKE